ncbi:right-handed parallel beta-helix repeat-containing protein [Streptomyces bathyalis]|uniref:Right-handed parallel beta-helix repeat-containing protein n=1 Tax=Streptomyces bathyalis TaxID=2710756 RepID=A0A7T1T7V4_9ACTN|nr:right-handed parallel beta-helix repeat-containing protein [Streptomyces bathyalis]QPP08025.1 right-handed parallel beta-helix repeat-containing protein [Streptomyces bathyalis]
MKIILRSGAVAAAFGVGLSLAVLPAVPAGAAAAIRVPCNDITALKNAINRANASANAGRIVLASHCTYNLTAPDNADDGLPEITGNVTISGRDTTIRRAPSATQDFRIFHVQVGGNLTLDSLAVSGGSLASGFGGGILNFGGTLNLNRTVLKGNSAREGGGIGNTGGRVDLDRTTVERNTASSFGGGIVNGGNGTLTMEGGALLKNRAATDNGGGLENILGTATLRSVSVRGNTAIVGGGIRNTNGSTLRMESSTVRDNIAVFGAGISNNASPATLVRSLVTRNTAITAGGGILNQGGGQVTLTDSRVVRNTPDNCSPAGSVPGCTNPAATVAPPASQLPPPSKDSKVRK